MPDNDKKYPVNVNICFLGPSAVGKTSLLATMYHAMHIGLPESFQFEPLATKKVQALLSAYARLGKIADEALPHRIVNDALVGTQIPQEYPFGFDFIQKGGKEDPQASFIFKDFPGSYMDPGQSSESSHGELKKYLNESDIIINAVDAGVLMGATEHNSEMYNGHIRAFHLLKEAFQDGTRNRIVIFALIKAEKWLAEKEKAIELKTCFEKRHKKVLNLFANGVPNRVGVYLPVETMGNIHYAFSQELENGEQIIHYKRVGGKLFSPRLVHLPLLYSLKFAMAELDRKKGMFAKIYQTLFGNYRALAAAMEKFDPNASHEENIEFYGNKDLLK